MAKLRIYKADIAHAPTNQSVIVLRPWVLQFAFGATIYFRSFWEARDAASVVSIAISLEHA